MGPSQRAFREKDGNYARLLLIYSGGSSGGISLITGGSPSGFPARPQKPTRFLPWIPGCGNHRHQAHLEPWHPSSIRRGNSLESFSVRKKARAKIGQAFSRAFSSVSHIGYYFNTIIEPITMACCLGATLRLPQGCLPGIGASAGFDPCSADTLPGNLLYLQIDYRK